MGGMFRNQNLLAKNPINSIAKPGTLFGNLTDPLQLGVPVDPVATPSIPPPAPTLGNSSGETDQAAMLQARNLQRGRSATLLTGGAGLPSLGVGSKSLLGM